MILFLTDPSPDFGVDYLADGFFRVFGTDAVVDYPSKPSLHGGTTGFDCDLNWSRVAAHDDPAFVLDMISSGRVDLFVMPTLRGDVPFLVRQWANVGLLDKVRDCTVCYDAEDHTADTRQHFVDALGYEPVAYFKRELPIGATWATPLPFGYPEERMVPVVGSLRSGVAYNAYLWEWSRGGLREQIAERMQVLTAATTPAERMSVEHNHRYNRAAICAISPSGQGSMTNRHLEVVSDGCAPIIQTLTVQWPDMFHGGTEALYFSTADEAVSHVRTLLGDPAYAIGMAQAAQACLRKHHTTAVRARAVYEAVHG